MKMKVTNASKANQGVWTDEGLVHIEPGQTRTLTIAEGYVERAKKLPFLKLTDPLDHDDNGEKGGAKHPDGEAATADDITAAIALLDAADDAHWTSTGLPMVEAVAEVAGKPVTRAAITEAAPDAKRPS